MPLDFPHQVESLFPKLKGTKQWGNYKEKTEQAKKIAGRKFNTKYGYLTLNEIAEKMGITRYKLDRLYRSKHKQVFSYSEILEKYEN